MAGKKILLTLNETVHQRLLKKANTNLMTPQEYISDIIRKDLLPQKK